MTTVKEKGLTLGSEPPLTNGKFIAEQFLPKSSRVKITPAMRECAKNVLRKGMKIGEALVKAGYSETQAKKGLRLVRNKKALSQAFREETRKIEAERQEDPLFPVEGALEGLIMNRLQSNIVKGEDKAVMSCKIAGSHKKLNLWTPELQQGIIILNAPGSGAALLSLPDIPVDED
jgi:hypothetical protein